MRESAFTFSLAAFSFVMTVIWGEPLLRVLRHFKVGKIIRVEEPGQHGIKMGTPTMGGVLFILPVLLFSGLLNAANILGIAQDSGAGRSVLVPMVVLILFGILGAVDDWQGIRGPRKGEGMPARTKFFYQWVLAIGTALVLKFVLDSPMMYLPGVRFEIEFPWYVYVPLAAFVIVAFSNAVNFTDGLDGLAGMISATAFLTYGLIALYQDQVFVSRFCFLVVGSLFAFLWFNAHPAQLFMGDAGSLALGATLATVAFMTGHWAVVLPVIAIIPVAEIVSVVIQILYFKATKGKRFFKMTPIHLHFELLGWSETQIVQRFWLIGLVAAMLGFGLTIV